MTSKDRIGYHGCARAIAYRRPISFRHDPMHTAAPYVHFLPIAAKLVRKESSLCREYCCRRRRRFRHAEYHAAWKNGQILTGNGVYNQNDCLWCAAQLIVCCCPSAPL